MVELGLQPKQCHHIFSSNSAGGVSESHKYPIQDRQLDTQELVHLKPLLLRLKAYEITSDGKLQDKYLDKKKKKRSKANDEGTSSSFGEADRSQTEQ